MSLSLAILINASLGLALLAGLAFAMASARRLAPHCSAAALATAAPAAVTPVSQLGARDAAREAPVPAAAVAA